MSWHVLSIIIPILLSVYLVITDFVDLAPFNDVSKHSRETRNWEILLNYPLPLVAAFCNWYGTTITTIVAILIGALFLFGNIFSWWVPYFFGCSDEARRHYEEAFGKTIKILPPIKNHPIPNLEHLPVAVLIILWLVTSIMNLYY